MKTDHQLERIERDKNDLISIAEAYEWEVIDYQPSIYLLRLKNDDDILLNIYLSKMTVNIDNHRKIKTHKRQTIHTIEKLLFGDDTKPLDGRGIPKPKIINVKPEKKTFVDASRHYKLKHPFWFGKYRGKQVKWIIDNDLQYFKWTESDMCNCKTRYENEVHEYLKTKTG